MIRTRFLGWFALVVWTPGLFASDTLVGVVSDRAAAEVAMAVDHFLTDQPDTRVLCRTPTQLAEMTDAQVRDFFSQGQSIFLAGVFGDQQSTGLKLTHLAPQPLQIRRLARRVHRWHQLRTIPAKEKRVAIIYYNHPPGRHNIGADNLDVIESLWDILHRLQKEGYQTGELPPTPELLLVRLQEIGVNLPEDSKALAHQAEHGLSVTSDQYEQWFSQLPDPLKREMVEGPLGYLHERLQAAVADGLIEEGQRLLETSLTDLTHILEKVATEDGRRARSLMDQLKTIYEDCLAEKRPFDDAAPFIRGLVDLHIEGLRGWGPPPGRVMTYEDRLLFPGLIFGNIFVGPQPPRGWELDEESLHANLTFPPTHQYMGFYFWLTESFGADAFVHLGRHSTYEFLPRKRAGLDEEDYSWHVAGEIPGIYPYIVDGVGEGIQARRRGLAVIVDHLTPPLSTTPLYDDLLTLRDLVESYEAAAGGEDSALKQATITRIRQTIAELNLRDELEAEFRHELHDESLVLERVDDELLVHEVGHYLTRFQESFMPMGLHIFGRPWETRAVDMMMTSMEPAPDQAETLKEHLVASPTQEMDAFLAALNGRFVAPGEGNDPIRTPAALPTGRNFHAIGGDVLPTRVAYDLGKALAEKAVADQKQGCHGPWSWATKLRAMKVTSQPGYNRRVHWQKTGLYAPF